jgi:multimeric flavodoxin WrbA
MKILTLCGSRNPRGRTASAVEAFADGAATAGADVETVFLPTLAIERCRQCDAEGWGICRTEGRCIIEDDFAGLVETIRAADAVVFATPVYFADLAESLRAFLDRLRRTCTREPGKEGIAGKTAVGVCVAGGGGGGAPDCCVAMERIVSRCGFDLVDVVPVRRQNLDVKRKLLWTTGKWVAQGAGAPSAS